MAYQDAKRAWTRLSRPSGTFVNPLEIRESFFQIYDAYNLLSQEVILCHNRIQEFVVSLANGLTTKAITFPASTYTTSYYIGADFSFDNGGHWQTAKTTIGFTLTWKTATVGAQTVRILVVE